MTLFLAEKMMPSEHELSAHNLHRISANADVNHTVIGFGCSYEDSARTFHLHALLDEYALIAFRDTIHEAAQPAADPVAGSSPL